MSAANKSGKGNSSPRGANHLSAPSGGGPEGSPNSGPVHVRSAAFGIVTRVTSSSDLAGFGLVGIGTDLVDIDRFRRVMRRQPSMAARLFTDDERAYAERAADPSPRLAARFAAKEATLKALGLGLGAMRMSEIEVVRADGGQPGLRLLAGADTTARDQGVSRWLVTLSHTDRLAQATVVALAR